MYCKSIFTLIREILKYKDNNSLHKEDFYAYSFLGEEFLFIESKGIYNILWYTDYSVIKNSNFFKKYIETVHNKHIINRIIITKYIVNFIFWDKLKNIIHFS